MKRILAIFIGLVWLLPIDCACSSDILIKNSAELKQFLTRQGAVSPGQKIILSKGAYDAPFNASGLKGLPGNPIVITGEVTAEDSKGISPNYKDFPTLPGMLLQNCNYVRVEGLHFTGGQRGITLGSCNDVTVKNVHVSKISNFGIMNYDSSNTTITSCLIEYSSAEHGIYLSGHGDNLLVSGNKIMNTHVNGIHCNGPLTNIKILNNQLINIGTYPDKEGGAAITLIGGATKALVEGNTFSNIYGQGITVGGTEIVITKNVFESYAWSGLLILPSSKSIKVIANQFLDKKVVPYNFNESILSSLESRENVFKISSGVVCLKTLKDGKTEVQINSSEWKKMGFD